MKKIRGKKFTTVFLLALLCFSMVAGLFRIPWTSIPEVHAAGGNSSLIGSLETIVNSVNYANDIDDVYQGMIVGETSMQQLINAYNALTTATLVFQWTPILSKLGYVNQTTIEWALDNQQMMSDGLPYTYLDGSKEAFLVYDRYMILAYGYTIQYSYDLAKWNLTQAYDSFKAAVVASTHPALLWMDQDGTPYTISYGPRYYDECGETIDCFLDFYNLGITAALNDSLSTWLWANNNLWSGTNYNYGLSWAGYECEAGGFLQIALKLWHADSLLPDTQNLITDIENRFLQEQFSSPQWLSGVVCHMAVSNPQLRLENTVMAWAAILGSYGELSSTYQTDVQDMLTGTGGTTTPAWLGLLQSSLCGSDFPYFLEHSDDSGTSTYATATGADLLFMLGIVPQSASLAVPVEENSYEYIYNIFDPELCNINLNTNVVTVSLAAAGTLNFQFNQTVTGSFGSPGIYAVQFSSDWNNLLNITLISALPPNRQYMYMSPLSYYINSSADSNSVISPSGNVMVNANFSQTFTYSAKSGYTIASVLVDDYPVPIAGSYTFDNVQTNHTISVASTVSGAVNPTITASADANGLISPSGSVAVNYGNDQVFTITPNTNYHIADIVVDGISVGALTSYVFASVTGPHTISASFAINSYAITVTQGADGQIAPGTTDVNYGNSQGFTVTPDAGYSIASLTVDGSPVAVASSYTFSNVQAAHSITATFGTNTYGVTVNVGTHGSSNLASQTVDWNTALNFVFTPDVGYSVADVTVNGSIDEGAVPSLSLTITGSTTVSVTFAISTYTVTVARSTDGQIAPLTSVVTYGAAPIFTITPDAGYHITSITANGASVNVTSPSGQTFQFNSISTDSSLTATFAINMYAITVTQTANGVISPDTVTANYGATPSFHITPATGYHIASITVDGTPVAVTSSAGQTFNFTNIQATHTIITTFAINSFIITSSAGAGGSIGPSKSISVNYGDNQTFAITPNTGYYIVDVRVNGSSVGAVSSYTFNNVQAAYTISATFALSPTIYWIAVAIVIGAIAAVVLYWSRKFDCA